jgi:hypothetical protein
MYALNRMACDSILREMTHENFNKWKESKKLAISGISSTTDESAITQTESDLTLALTCLQTAVSEKTQGSFSVTSLYDQKLQLQKSIDDKIKTNQVSKDRVALLTNPERKTTVYESWFPLQRPLKLSTLLILLVIGLFFISISIGILLKQFGITLDISLVTRIPGATSGLSKYINPLTLGLAGALVITIGVIIYLIQKKG